jgi:transcriptional regulator with XRE-family HTH domain
MGSDAMQSSDDRVHSYEVVSHPRADRKRKFGKTMLATPHRRRGKGAAMPPRQSDPYDPAAMRAAVQSAVDHDGRTVNAIAVAAEVSPNVLVHILGGKTEKPQIDGLVRIARALGLTVSELIGETSPRDPAAEPENGIPLVEELEALREAVFQQVTLVSRLHDRMKRRVRKP